MALATALWLVGPARADQRDPRLPSLFAELKSITDPDAVSAIRAAIWSIWYESPNETVRELMGRAEVAMERGQSAVALAAYDAIIAAEPDFAEGWNRRATLNFLLGRYPQSLKDIEETLKREPRHFGALSGCGQIRAIMGDFDGAIEAYEAALAIFPTLPGTREMITLLRRQRQLNTP